MTPLIRGAVLLIAFVTAIAGCEVIEAARVGPSAAVAVPYPDGCEAYGMSPRRCDAVVAAAREWAEIGDRSIASIELTSEPPCDASDPMVLCAYTTSFAANVRFHFEDGQVQDQQVRCSVGGQYTILCTEHPQIWVGGAVIGGYRDVPCGDENGDDCATPLPAIEPAAADAARPLVIDALDIPIDHLGPYEIDVGQAILPNGIVSAAELTLVDAAPTTFEVEPDGGLSLDLRSDAPDGRPFENYYAHGWRSGTEPATVLLRFEVVRFDPGAVLQIDHLEVR